LRGDHAEELLAALVEGNDLLLDVILGKELLLGVLLLGFFFLLMSWMTPMTSSRCEMSGTVSIDLVR
jgi:hypothetical protein